MRTQMSPPPKPRIVSGLRPTQEEGNNPKDRYGYGLAKVPLSTLPLASLPIMAMAMKGGAQDYGIQNYRKEKVQGRVYLEAALRHLLALLDGEDIDPKRGIHHGGFIMATIGIYLDALVNGNLIDNRALPGCTGDLIELFNDPPNHTSTPEELRSKFDTFMRRHGQYVIGNQVVPTSAVQEVLWTSATETEEPRHRKKEVVLRRVPKKK